MSKQSYYTTEQLATETEKLLKSGQPMWAIANDPQCPPDVAARMLQLKKMYNPTQKED